MYNYPSHADVRFGAFRCYVLMHLASFRLVCFVALCGSCSKFGFYCGFLFNSPYDISQSMRKRKYEFVRDVIREAVFGSRQLILAKINWRAGAKKNVGW